MARPLMRASDNGAIFRTSDGPSLPEGPEYYDQAFQHNSQFATPGPYNTALSPEDEQGFRSWVGTNKVPFHPDDPVSDYDMRGFWKNDAGAGTWKPGEHFPDEYKTPYDTTFSQESKYSTPDNPFAWNDHDQLMDTRSNNPVTYDKPAAPDNAPGVPQPPRPPALPKQGFFVRGAPTTPRKGLVVVDVQNDFVNGALPVPGGEQAAQKLGTMLRGQDPGLDHHGYHRVVSTQDWHHNPTGHFSDTPDFATTWPTHCRAGTPGADLHPALDGARIDHRFFKGHNSAAYSGFEGTDGTGPTPSGTGLADYLRGEGITDLDIAGIATDHCVRATALDGAKNGFKTRVLLPYSAAVNPTSEAKAIAEMRQAGVDIAGESPSRTAKRAEQHPWGDLTQQAQQGGFTWRQDAPAPEQGYMVSISPQDVRSRVSPSYFRNFYHQHDQDWKDPENFMGDWHNQKYYTDVSHHEPTLWPAVDTALDHDQLAIYDIKHHFDLDTQDEGYNPLLSTNIVQGSRPPGFEDHWGLFYTALAAPHPEPSTLKLVKSGVGTHGGEIHQDTATGTQWLLKPSHGPQDSFLPDLDVATSQIATQSGLEAPETFLGKHPSTGAKSSYQVWYPGSKAAFAGKSINPETVTDPDLLEIQKHHALDWMIGNHDSHGGQFLRDGSGKLVGIDKGQAFRYVNRDRLHWNYHPNGALAGESEPIYNTLWRNFAKGGRQVFDPRQGELAHYIQGLQDIPDQDYAASLFPYAQGAAKAGGLGVTPASSYEGHNPTQRFAPNDVQGFLQAALARKNNLMSDMGDLYDRALAHRTTGLKIARVAKLADVPDPASMIPIRQAAYWARPLGETHLPTHEVDGYRMWDSDPEESPGLLQSVHDNGIKDPVELYTDGDFVEIWDGEHRTRAARGFGIPHLPVKVTRVPTEHFTGPLSKMFGKPPKAGPGLKAWLAQRTAAMPDPASLVPVTKPAPPPTGYTKNYPWDKGHGQQPSMSKPAKPSPVTVGSHGSQIYTDPQGEWVIKYPNAGNEFLVPLDVATAQLQSMAGLESPETYALPFRGGMATAVRVYRGPHGEPRAPMRWPDHVEDSSHPPAKLYPKGSPPHLSDMTPEEQLIVQKHHALDWLLANHDAHVGNWLNTDKGLVGIDKGQALKYFGQDRLHYRFHPNYYAKEPIHNGLWKDFARGGKGEMLDPREGELGDFVKGVQDIPDWKLRQMFAPYAWGAANAGMLATGKYGSGAFTHVQPDPSRGLHEQDFPPNDPGAFLDALVARKHNLSNDLGAYYDQMATERQQSLLHPPPPRPPAPQYPSNYGKGYGKGQGYSKSKGYGQGYSKGYGSGAAAHDDMPWFSDSHAQAPHPQAPQKKHHYPWTTKTKPAPPPPSGKFPDEDDDWGVL